MYISTSGYGVQGGLRWWFYPSGGYPGFSTPPFPPPGFLPPPLWELLGPLGDPLGKAWGPSGTSWDPLGTPWRALWDHLEVLLDTLGVSWGFFRGNLELQGTSLRFQRVPRRALGGILGALWRLRKGLRSNSLQYAKTIQFTARYCKNRGPKRVDSLKI